MLVILKVLNTSMTRRLVLIFSACIIIVIFALYGFKYILENTQGARAAIIAPMIVWQEVETGYSVGRYDLTSGNKVLKSEVLLARFDPKLFSFQPVVAKDYGGENDDILNLAKKEGALAGINANFFDEKGNALGLIISNFVQKNRMHKGGKLINAIFYVKNSIADIVLRKNFDSSEVESAIQGGPRLIKNSRRIKLSFQLGSSRRSGIAITKDGQVILFATMLRFPGATLRQVQDMLKDPALNILHALNLDGGGSSQLFIEKNSVFPSETFVTGGDRVPVALLVKRK